MTADLPAQPLDLDAILDLVEGYGDARESVGAAFDLFSDAEIAKRDAEADQLFDAIRAEVERVREVVDAAVAWRQWIAPRLVDVLNAGPEENVLIAAVDKLTEGSGR